MQYAEVTEVRIRIQANFELSVKHRQQTVSFIVHRGSPDLVIREHLNADAMQRILKSVSGIPWL